MKPPSSSNLQKQLCVQIENVNSEEQFLPKIPDDIIFDEILVRVPVKCLLWFQGVCKNWNRRILSKNFVESHLKHHSLKKDTGHLLLAKSGPENNLPKKGPGKNRLPKMVVMSIEESGATSTNPIYSSPPHELNTWTHELDGFKIISSCRGLVCAVATYSCIHTEFHHVVFVWNPFTGAYKDFLCPALSSSKIRNETANPSMTLGYDPANDDYKVIRVSPRLNNEAPLHIEILSLKNKRWMTLETTDASRLVGAKRGLTRTESVASEDGRLYMAVTGCLGMSGLFRFNLMEENFTRIEDPPMAQVLCYGTFKLGLYNGALCLYHLLGERMNRFSCGINIWILVSDESWMKLINIPEKHCRE